ncbi:sigma-70 region 4 domain-containing protein [Sphingomonas sp. RT2P30]|uniref:sigma-70 region 4 domain-containing protein n=1 Tax=Parasphingomonas halimpatiens TaxID=3096162 RepID=UPI002FC63F98
MNESIDPSLYQRARRAFERTIVGRDDHRPEIVPEAGEIARIEDAVCRLRPLQREIFLAVRLDDCSYADIAERTGLTVAQVEGQFAKSMYNLMRNLDNPRRHWWRRWLG